MAPSRGKACSSMANMLVHRALLLLAASSLWLASALSGSGQASTTPCRGDDAERGADEVLQYWRERTRACNQAIANGSCTLTAAGLKRIESLKASRNICAFTYTYSPGHKWTLHDEGYCNHAVLLGRSQALLSLLEALGPSFLAADAAPFSFMVYMNDGVRAHDDLRCYFGLPSLTEGPTPLDRCSVPFPHNHFLMAMQMEYAPAASVPKAARGFATYVHRLFSGTGVPSAPWDSKRAVVSFRAGCKGTLTPDDPATGKSSWMQPRGALCSHMIKQAANTTPTATPRRVLVEVGIVYDDNDNGAKVFMEGCRPCRMTDRASTSDQVSARYLVASEGIGVSSEATYVKLRSGSTVLWPYMDGYDHHLYQMWYQPLLWSRGAYIPTTMEGVVHAAEQCELDEESRARCRKIAEAGQHIATCHVTLAAGRLYLMKAVQLMQELYAQGAKGKWLTTAAAAA